jgi:orotate phosphoribosyltransferase
MRQRALLFGEFKTKAGRLSPYFFNAGSFHDGASLRALTRFYAQTILSSGIQFDMLFGPAYKGIALAAGVAIALADMGRNVNYSSNRKEAKDHGEGGSVIGAPLAGRVLIIDDVITAGTSVRESVDLIRKANAEPCGIVIALDRKERGTGTTSAALEVEATYHVPVMSIATLDDLIAFLEGQPPMSSNLAALRRYREQYGVALQA